jgi:hypothetical protein
MPLLVFHRVYTDWRYSQLFWYFRPSFVNYCSLTCIYTVCTSGGIGLCGEHIQEWSWHCVFDQFLNLQNCFTTPNKNLGAIKKYASPISDTDPDTGRPINYESCTIIYARSTVRYTGTFITTGLNTSFWKNLDFLWNIHMLKQQKNGDITSFKSDVYGTWHSYGYWRSLTFIIVKDRYISLSPIYFIEILSEFLSEDMQRRKLW